MWASKQPSPKPTAETEAEDDAGEFTTPTPTQRCSDYDSPLTVSGHDDHDDAASVNVVIQIAIVEEASASVKSSIYHFSCDLQSEVKQHQCQRASNQSRRNATQRNEWLPMVLNLK
jgi:hypothetical protein